LRLRKKNRLTILARKTKTATPCLNISVAAEIGQKGDD
jgi:hypothetical protein